MLNAVKHTRGKILIVAALICSCTPVGATLFSCKGQYEMNVDYLQRYKYNPQSLYINIHHIIEA